MKRYLVIIEVHCWDENAEDYDDEIHWTDDVIVQADSFDEARSKAVKVGFDSYHDLIQVIVKAIDIY